MKRLIFLSFVLFLLSASIVNATSAPKKYTINDCKEEFSSSNESLYLCYSGVARDNNNLEICEIIEDDSMMSYCKGIVSKNPSYCENAGISKSSCYFYIAPYVKDSSLCYKLNYSDNNDAYVQQCLNAVSKGTMKKENVTINGRDVSVMCERDEDCEIVNKEINYSSCCITGECDPDYSLEKYVSVNKDSFNSFRESVKYSGSGEACTCVAAACAPRTPKINNYTAKCFNNKCVKAEESSSGTVESNISGNFSIPAVCGNGICEVYEADDPGGCGPNADPRCLGPPSRIGICPQDCKYQNKSLPGEGKTKILPETASEIAKERLGELGFNITLKEVGNNKSVYEARAEKEVKIFGLFKKRVAVTAEIDAETGDIIKIRKPWWAFIASGI